MRFARRSLALGAVAPVVFVVCAAVAGAGEPGYSHVSDHLSGLAAVGAEQRWVMTAAFVALGAGVALIGAAIGLIEGSRAVPATVVLAGTLIVLLGVFPRGCVALDCAHPPWHHRVHDVVSVPSYVLAALLPLVVATGGRRLPASRRVATLVVATTGLLLTVFLTGFGESIGGLLQRAALLPPLLWLTATSVRWASTLP